MEIPAHILDAVQTSDPSPPRRIKSTTSLSVKSPVTTRFQRQYASHISQDDRSSGSEVDLDYDTDFTTPASSESNPEDMASDEVEEFRDREYPQLKGKTYMDHGGTTVCMLLV